DIISEKGGQQTNIFESNLCDNCGDEANKRLEKIKNDYQLNVWDKLIVFSPETTAQIEKEIGRDEAQETVYDLSIKNKKIKDNDRFQ
ncbi:9332_t:CDS:1, partial [Ambispora leptoticha]